MSHRNPFPSALTLCATFLPMILAAAQEVGPNGLVHRGRVNELYRSEHRQYLSLSGTWQLELDAKDEGLAGRWFDPAGKRFGDTVAVPGCLEHQGVPATR